MCCLGPKLDNTKGWPAIKPEPGMFWIQLVFPGVDDGSKPTDEIKKELRANEITKKFPIRASQFQYVNRTVLSRQNLGG